MTENPGSAKRWQRLRQLFDSAQSIDRKQHPQWLASECGGDDELRETLDGLLAAARAKTEIIDMAIDSASRKFLRNLHSEPPKQAEAGNLPRLSANTRRAFACIEAFFYSSAHARKGTDRQKAGVDLNLARVFGRAGTGGDARELAEHIERLLDCMREKHPNGETLAALRYWLDIVDDGSAEE